MTFFSGILAGKESPLKESFAIDRDQHKQYRYFEKCVSVRSYNRSQLGPMMFGYQHSVKKIFVFHTALTKPEQTIFGPLLNIIPSRPGTRVLAY